MSHNNRGRISLRPITGRWRHLCPPGWSRLMQALALVYFRDAIHFPSGVLVRHAQTGRLSVYAGGTLLSIDQDKAEAALLGLEAHDE